MTLRWPAPRVSLETDWFSDNRASRQIGSHWYLRDSPRPLVVLVGGWTPVRGPSERLLWPIKQLDRAGYDVVLPTLAASADGAFPGRDPSRNIIELVRAAASIEQLLLLGHDLGHDPILVWGSSLGAHIVALLITLRTSAYVSLYVLEKPLTRLSEPLRWHGHGAINWRHEVADRLDRVYRCVSPLDRLSRVDPKQVLVIGGKFDQVTPIASVELLAKHFNAPLRQTKASHLFDPHRSDRLLKVVMAQRAC
jgi:pimeloyl-ACP methyl ester carboxylesterase